MEEIWKDIPGYEGMYQISNLGTVKSLERKVWNGKNYHTSKEKILKSNKCGKNRQYLKVVLFENNKGYSKKLHQLVAIAFLGHKPCGYDLVVDHINNNPLDNRVENLQIITSRENIHKDSKSSSPYPGVSFYKITGKWRSQISINKKIVSLGYFKSEIEASEAYKKKLITL